MNDIERRLRWHEVRNDLYMENLADWPAALPAPSIAWLRRLPDENKGKSQKKYRDFYSFLMHEINTGRLLERGGPVEVNKTTRESVFRDLSIARDGAEVGESAGHSETIEVRTVRADDLAALFQGVCLEMYLDAWLAPYRQQGEKNRPDAAKKTGKQKDESTSQAALVADVLTLLKARAEAAGDAIDLENMPGQKAHFLDLMQKLEPSFKNMTSVQSLDRYLKGKCKWSLQARFNPDATPLYKKLFPEAWITPRAVSENRKKA